MPESFAEYQARVLGYLGSRDPIRVQRATPAALDRRLVGVRRSTLVRRPAPAPSRARSASPSDAGSASAGSCASTITRASSSAYSGLPSLEKWTRISFGRESAKPSLERITRCSAPTLRDASSSRMPR